MKCVLLVLSAGWPAYQLARLESRLGRRSTVLTVLLHHVQTSSFFPLSCRHTDPNKSIKCKRIQFSCSCLKLSIEKESLYLCYKNCPGKKFVSKQRWPSFNRFWEEGLLNTVTLDGAHLLEPLHPGLSLRTPSVLNQPSSQISSSTGPDKDQAGLLVNLSELGPGRLEEHQEDGVPEAECGSQDRQMGRTLTEFQLKCGLGWRRFQQALFSCATCCVKCLGPVWQAGTCVAFMLKYISRGSRYVLT